MSSDPNPGRRAAGTGERIVRANGVDLCVQAFGDPADPAILLMAGNACSMHWWREEFCLRLAERSRYVIRYDNRDTGRSVSYQPGAAPYTGRDLAADAVGLLDALDLPGAHLVGWSMGGGLAQLIALEHPERVASLTLISTSPAGPGQFHPDLPPMTDELGAHFAGQAPPADWSDRAAVIDWMVASERALARSQPFDEAAVRQFLERDLDRSASPASRTNHFAIGAGEPWRHRLPTIAAATLVIHGTEDPLFPYGHAVALATGIPDAELVPLPDTGHELPRAGWDTVIAAIARHTSPRRPGRPRT